MFFSANPIHVSFDEIISIDFSAVFWFFFFIYLFHILIRWTLIMV